MTDIVLNRCSRGTLLSEAGLQEYARRKGLASPPAPETIERTDADLIAMMRANPAKFGGACSHIRIITIPDSMAWKIMRDGNYEWVAPGG